MTTPRTFKAGDTVKHGPTGETWFLLEDEKDGHVRPAGWPVSRARADDCTLVEEAAKPCPHTGEIQ